MGKMGKPGKPIKWKTSRGENQKRGRRKRKKLNSGKGFKKIIRGKTSKAGNQ